MNNEPEKLRVLLVDDENDILDLYCNILSHDSNLCKAAYGSEGSRDGFLDVRELLPDFERFETTRCNQGNEAIDAVKQSLADNHPYAITLLDIRMPPGPDGLETAVELRKLDPLLNIVIVTAYPELPPLDIARLIPPLGRLLFMQKPVLPLELIQISSVLADKWRAEQQLR
ncbi:MAG: response regulator [Thermodesulfobacteriota bacterium]